MYFFRSLTVSWRYFEQTSLGVVSSVKGNRRFDAHVVMLNSLLTFVYTVGTG